MFQKAKAEPDYGADRNGLGNWKRRAAGRGENNGLGVCYVVDSLPGRQYDAVFLATGPWLMKYYIPPAP
jgi:hypothetical protein